MIRTKEELYESGYALLQIIPEISDPKLQRFMLGLAVSAMLQSTMQQLDITQQIEQSFFSMIARR